MELEKAYYSVKPVYERIEKRINLILEELKAKKPTPLTRRVANFRASFLDMKKTRGYDSASFQMMFNLVKKMQTMAPKEILTPQLYAELKKRIQLEVKEEKTAEKPELKFDFQNSSQYLMLINGNMRFLASYHVKVWQKNVPNRAKPLRIRIKSLGKPNEFLFNVLPGEDQVRASKHKKIALLLEMKNGEKKGILVDEIEGSIFMKSALMKEKLEYFKVNPKRYEPFIRLKGERYFLKDLSVM